MKKPAAKYQPLAERMAQEINTVCASCSEAARFRAEFTAAALAVS